MTFIRVPPQTAGVVRDEIQPAVVRQRVLGGLAFVVPKVPLPAGYAVGMTLLAGCLVLLPVAYGGLVAFLAWLAAWHAWQAAAAVAYGPYWLFHLPMALAGAVLVTFLVKPVFFRRTGKRVGVVTLTPAEQPLLFEAVNRLCAATGAARPTTIEVDCEPNAHARFDTVVDSVRGGETWSRESGCRWRPGCRPGSCWG